MPENHLARISRWRRGALLLLLALPLTLAVRPPAAEGDDTAPDGEAAAAAEATFRSHKCNLCHAVSAVGIEPTAPSAKLHGPDLSGWHGDIDRAELARFLRQEVEHDGQKHKRAFKGSDEELAAILDWLASLPAAEATGAEDGGAR